jgi:GTP-binding protein
MIDTITILVCAGQGGDGAVSFRREKNVSKGGPNGGNGGHGGSVYVVGSDQITTLLGYEGRKEFHGDNGVSGKGKDMYGKKGQDRELEVPVGTEVWDDKEGVLLGEVLERAQRMEVARGGAGGRGNASFATATQRVPYIAEKGGAGETRKLRLELKLMADVGIVGKPNAGKSTLLGAASAARAKVASYPFTTLEPELGVVSVGWQSFVLAEIPGLIKGAHQGVGLGQEFLRHATRTRLLIHLVDGSEEDVAGAVQDINEELEAYGAGLESKPQFLVVNKVDMPVVAAQQEAITAALGEVTPPVQFISAATSGGVGALMKLAASMLNEMPELEARTNAIRRILRASTVGPGKVSKVGDVYVVENVAAARLAGGSDLNAWAGRVQLKAQLDRLGVSRALERAGCEIGDIVWLGDVEMEW